jgi:hypothetical protein
VASVLDAPKVEAFNRRMATAGSRYRLTLNKGFKTVADRENSPITQEKIFCFDDEEIRGGASVKRMTFRVNGSTEEVATWVAPVSEGLVNPDFAMVAPRIEREVRRRFPLIYSTGALDSPAGQMMYRGGWYTHPVPFHFAVLRASPFLRNISYLRRGRLLRVVTDVAALSGAGKVGLALLRFAQQCRGQHPDVSNVTIERVEKWGEWVDDVWESVRGKYSLIGDRSRNALEALYPSDNPHFIRLRFKRTGTDQLLGWAVVTVSKLKNHNYFGGMVLGSIIDVLALPENAYAAASGTLMSIRESGGDLVVVNHSDCRWNEAFKRAGMMSARTNHFLFLGRELEKRLRPLEENIERFYFTRGDGHGPMNLW